MASTPPNSQTGGLSLPPWAVTLVGGIMISAVTSYGTYQFAAGKQQAQIEELNTYMASEKARKQKQFEEYEAKRAAYAEKMEDLLMQYKNAAPTPKTP